MSTLFALSDQSGARVNAVAARDGVDPNLVLEKLVRDNLPPVELIGEDDELGGKTFGEVFGDLIGAVDAGPADLGRSAETYTYMQGFGEAVSGS